ncbi:hypothetical protein [Hymenobacter sp. BRD67]|uniref:hypothetical protein n=1 Tax=Hymenobacter sp. BRD67 TaxID=2675877 RepID=UPI001563A5A0|nr:hypothetical protein [Hymenobacter sp. BRD67]QKG54562.1 hypothetical protein GKZ67_20640 [Hymenobacter sp. BRD67]
MKNTLHCGRYFLRRGGLYALLGWLLMALGPHSLLAQTTDPTGGTLSPATTTVCTGFNSGTLTLTGYSGTILKFQQDAGSGYVDIANSATSTYTFSNLTQTTKYRALVRNNSGTTVASTEATVTVNQPPTATINSSGPTTFCTRALFTWWRGRAAQAIPTSFC